MDLRAQDNESEINPDMANPHAPNFVWLVRDFVLKLEIKGKGGAPVKISETDYMEMKISGSRYKDKPDRKIIQQTFQKRDCFCLPSPVKDGKLLKELGMGQAEQNGLLKPEFVNGIIKLKQFVIENTPSKMNINKSKLQPNGGVNKPMKGNVLANLIE